MTTKTGGIDSSNLDRQIEQLMQCRPLPEAEIRGLCEKVPNARDLEIDSHSLIRQKKF